MFSEMTREWRCQFEAAVALILSQLLILGERTVLPIAGPLVPAMLPLLIFALRWGPGWGILASLACGLLRLFTRRALLDDWWTFFLEQTVSFAALGVAGIFRGRKNTLLPAVVLALGLRYSLLFWSSCRYRASEIPDTYMYITLTSPKLYYACYHGLALCLNLCLCMAVCTPLLYPLRRFFAGADLLREPGEEDGDAEAEESEEPLPEEEPALFLFRDRYAGTPSPGQTKEVSRHPDWTELRTDQPHPKGAETTREAPQTQAEIWGRDKAESRETSRTRDRAQSGETSQSRDWTELRTDQPHPKGPESREAAHTRAETRGGARTQNRETSQSREKDRNRDWTELRTTPSPRKTAGERAAAGGRAASPSRDGAKGRDWTELRTTPPPRKSVPEDVWNREPVQRRSLQPPSHPSSGTSAASGRAAMWNRSMTPEPANAEKTKPFQRKEHYNPYDWYDKRDRDRMPNRH